MASHPRNDRPKAVAVGQTPQAMFKQNSDGFDQSNHNAASTKAIPSKFNGNSQGNKNKGGQTVKMLAMYDTASNVESPVT